MSESHESASARNNVPTLRIITVRCDGALVEHEPSVLHAAARFLKNNAQADSKTTAAAPSKIERHSTKNSKPLNTTPLAPNAASAIGNAQHDDEMSAPKPTVAPKPASQPVESWGDAATRGL